MSALSTVTSTLTESTTEKKAEEGYGRIVPASGGLHVIAEDGDADEAAQVAGDVAQAFTADEEDAVRRKLDRRILPLLAIIYFSQYLDKNSKRAAFLGYVLRFPTHSDRFAGINYASVVGGFPISGSHYTIIVAVFYVGFFIAEIPQSIISQRFPIAR
jgi:ACS family allantoate permease-like MFS transporter